MATYTDIIIVSNYETEYTFEPGAHYMLLHVTSGTQDGAYIRYFETTVPSTGSTTPSVIYSNESDTGWIFEKRILSARLKQIIPVAGNVIYIEDELGNAYLKVPDFGLNLLPDG